MLSRRLHHSAATGLLTGGQLLQILLRAAQFFLFCDLLEIVTQRREFLKAIRVGGPFSYGRFFYVCTKEDDYGEFQTVEFMLLFHIN